MLDRCQLLASVRVLDAGGPSSDGVGRLLADLGADVLRVEPPGGVGHRAALPTVSGASIAFALDNANKRSVVLDPADAGDRGRFIELVASADILIDGGGAAGCRGVRDLSGGPGRPVRPSGGTRDDRLRHLGSTGELARHRPVLYAMSTALSRSGPTNGRPVLPPAGIASATAAVQATWVALVAYYDRLRCGRGDYIDFARYRRRRPVPGSTVRCRGSGCRREEAVGRTVARAATKPADLPDVPVPRRVRQDLPAVSAPVARHAGLAGRTRAVRRPHVRDHRRPLPRRRRVERRHRRAVRAPDDGHAGHGGSAQGRADRGSVHPRRGVGLGALPVRRRADRPRTRLRRDAVGAGRTVRGRRPAGRASQRRARRQEPTTVAGSARRGHPSSRAPAGPAGRSRVCASWTSGSSSPAGSSVGCSPTSGPR